MTPTSGSQAGSVLTALTDPRNFNETKRVLREFRM